MWVFYREDDGWGCPPGLYLPESKLPQGWLVVYYWRCGGYTLWNNAMYIVESWWCGFLVACQMNILIQYIDQYAFKKIMSNSMCILYTIPGTSLNRDIIFQEFPQQYNVPEVETSIQNPELLLCRTFVLALATQCRRCRLALANMIPWDEPHLALADRNKTETNHNLLSQWPTFRPLGITYLVETLEFQLLFHGPLAEWGKGTSYPISNPWFLWDEDVSRFLVNGFQRSHGFVWVSGEVCWPNNHRFPSDSRFCGLANPKDDTKS